MKKGKTMTRGTMVKRVPLSASAFILEYDAVRQIAQGLGVHLAQCQSLVEVKGDKARLLPGAERTQYLFGKDEGRRRK